MDSRIVVEVLQKYWSWGIEWKVDGPRRIPENTVCCANMAKMQTSSFVQQPLSVKAYQYPINSEVGLCFSDFIVTIAG